MQVIKGNIVSPFLSVLISSVLLGIVVVLLLDIFKIKNTVFKYITAIIIAVAPNISATLMFYYCSDAYIMAFLFATIAVFIIDKMKNRNVLPVIIGSIFIALSLGMYQTYISIALVLFMTLFLISLIKKEDMKTIIKNVFKYFFTVVIGFGIYYILLQLALKVRGIELSGYSGANEIGLNTLLEMPRLLPQAYERFIEYYFKNNILPNTTWHTNIMYVFLFGITLGAIIYLIAEKKVYKRIPLIIISLVLFPLCFGTIELIVPNANIHILMACSYILVFPIFFSIIELVDNEEMKTIIRNAIIIFTIVVTWIYIWQDNASYVYMNKRNEQMKTSMNRILTRIESMEEYNKDVPILFVGRVELNEYFSKYDRELKSKTWGFISCWPMIWVDYDVSYERFFNEYAGVELNVVREANSKDILETEEYKEMEVYPSNKSIKFINNTVVVKLK